MIKLCKCGDSPRVQPMGDKVYLYCISCGYRSRPFFYDLLSDVIDEWNNSDKGVINQRAEVNN